MPSNVRRTDGLPRRAAAAVGVPVALAAVAGALTLATPALAAGGSNPLPFPTLCGTASPTTASAGPSASATASRSTTATPRASASPRGTTAPPTKPGAGHSAGPSGSPSPSATASKSAAVGGNGVPASPPPTPAPTATASPSASPSDSSSGGFWGWLNGVWTWIFGSAPLPRTAAAPAVDAVYVRPATKSDSQVHAAANALAAAVNTQAAPAPTASCVPKSAVKANAATSDGDVAAEVPWHLTSPSVTMYSLTYNGVTTIKTNTGSLQVLDLTAAKVTLSSMVTYSRQSGGKLQYINGGPGQTVTLTDVHLWSTSFTADVLGLIHQTFTPQNPGLLTVLQGLTIPIPLLFTHVEADNAFLSTQSIVIPGFDGHGN